MKPSFLTYALPTPKIFIMQSNITNVPMPMATFTQCILALTPKYHIPMAFIATTGVCLLSCLGYDLITNITQYAIKFLINAFKQQIIFAYSRPLFLYINSNIEL
jgi:hypothetical protein